MTQSEALEILGLSPGASRSEINQRYKKLMLGVHPDQGGSSYLATQLNRARAVLLEGSQS
jgi:curved DNA-binding protein CbpA